MLSKDEIIQKFHIKVLGDSSQTLMFTHGYGCDQNMWRFIYPHYQTKYKIVLFDLLGSGNSNLAEYDFEKYNSLNGYADDIIEIIETMQLKNVTFVGHSVSAMIGVLAANKSSQLFRNLVLIGPSPCYINKEGYFGGFESKDIDELIQALESNYLGWSSYITPIIMGNEDKPQLAEELNNSFCRTDPKIAQHFGRVTFLSDNRKDLDFVEVSTLILQCQKDVIAPVAVGDYVHKKIKNSHLEMLPSTGHCPHLSDPQSVINAIDSFLTTENI